MRTATLFAPLALTLALMEGTSAAWVQPAMVGHQWPSNDGSFAYGAWDMIQNNNLNNRALWIIPFQANGYSGSLHAYARVQGNPYGTSDTDCQAFAIDSTNTEFSFSSKVTTFSTSLVTLDLGTFSGTTHGTFHFECNVGREGGAVVNVEAS